MDRYSRRKFTGLLGTAAVAALAGCSGDNGEGEGNGTNGTTEAEPTTEGTTMAGNETTMGNGTEMDGNASGNASGNATDGGASLAGDASVSFVEPQDGATVTGPVQVEMRAEGFTVEPAGEVTENAGHFHIMVDTGAVPQGEVIPSDDQHLHFGDGSTTAELDLEPGQHTLVLQPGNGVHEAYDVTDEISITVEEGQGNASNGSA